MPQPNLMLRKSTRPAKDVTETDVFADPSLYDTSASILHVDVTNQVSDSELGVYTSSEPSPDASAELVVSETSPKSVTGEATQSSHYVSEEPMPDTLDKSASDAYVDTMLEIYTEQMNEAHDLLQPDASAVVDSSVEPVSDASSEAMSNISAESVSNSALDPSAPVSNSSAVSLVSVQLVPNESAAKVPYLFAEHLPVYSRLVTDLSPEAMHDKLVSNGSVESVTGASNESVPDTSPEFFF